MFAYCGRPRSAASCDRSPYICVRYARETIAGSCSIWVALATATISQTGSHRGASIPIPHLRNTCVNGITMEVNQLKRQLKDLGERIASLRGFL